MKTPALWQSDNALSKLLAPLSLVYDAAQAAYRKYYPRPLAFPVPVICIGNLTAGGAGKTPVALAVGKRLKERGVNAYFLSRGYGGRVRDPVLVNPNLHTAYEVGDEPLLLSHVLPTIVAKDRVSGALYALQRGAQAIVTDDGFQNPSLAKTLSILVLDGVYGYGNGRLLPAGPLRERPEEGFRRADAAVVIGAGNADLRIPAGLPTLSAELEPLPAGRELEGKRVLAFCGIATPRKFFDTLAALGANIVGTAAFADHYYYTPDDIKSLSARARKEQALLVTTAKDMIRLTPELRALATAVEVRLKFAEPSALDALLDTALKYL